MGLLSSWSSGGRFRPGPVREVPRPGGGRFGHGPGGFLPGPQLLVLVHDPPHQVGVDAVKHGIQRRVVERPVIGRPPRTFGLIHRAMSADVIPVHRCSRQDRTSALIFFRASLLIAGRNEAAKYAAQGGSNIVATAIATAKAQIGKPYQWGAAGPGAYDCSGLVYAAYAAAGIHIARTTYQWQQDGPVIPLSQIQPGDLLFSAGSDGTPADPGHVVMYLGDGQVIQAPQTGEDVQIDPLDLASVVIATRPAHLATTP